MWQIFVQFNFLYMHREKLVANSDISGSSEDRLIRCSKTVRGEQSMVTSVDREDSGLMPVSYYVKCIHRAITIAWGLEDIICNVGQVSFLSMNVK